MVSKVAGSNIVIPVGENSVNFSGIITLNETGFFLWNILVQGAEREELIEKLMSEYEVDYENALKDIDLFIKKLKDADLVE